MPEKMSIVMLGQSGVGKTSVIAAMYQKFTHALKTINFAMSATPATITELGYRLKDFQRMLAAPDGKIAPGIEGTIELRHHIFELGKVNQPKTLELTFTDYPGGWIENKPDRVEKHIRDAFAIIIAIDAPALMEDNGSLNMEFNNPFMISNVIERSFTKRHEFGQIPRLIIFVPVKCEKYIHKKQGEALADKVEDSFRPLIDSLKHSDMRDQIAIVISPVETVGNLEFDYFERNNKSPIPTIHFRKIPPATYAPKYGEQPFLCLLRFMLKIYYKEKDKPWWVPKFLYPVSQIVNRFLNSGILNAIDSLAKMPSPKASEGYRIVMGQHLLNIGEKQ